MNGMFSRKYVGLVVLKNINSYFRRIQSIVVDYIINGFFLDDTDCFSNKNKQRVETNY